MSTASPSPDFDLKLLTLALRDLHKNLVQVAKAEYETALTTLVDAAQLLQLLTKDPYFDWLHELSEFMVTVDELIDTGEMSPEDKQGILAQARSLFMPEEGKASDFYRRYVTYLQEHPTLTMSHANVRKILATASIANKT